MPLKVIRRRDTGKLWIVGTVRGTRVRQRASSDNEKLAGEEAAVIEAGVLRDTWHGRRPDRHRRLGEAVESYLKHEQRSVGTRALLRRLLHHFGDVLLGEISQGAVDQARVMLRVGASPGTIKRNLVCPLQAVLGHAARRGWCDTPHFDQPTETRGRTRFLLPEQAGRLLEVAAPHLQVLLRFLVCTGCRMSEALGLDWQEADLLAGRAILWEGETKGGGRRIVLIPPAGIAACAGLPGRAGRVFLDHRGRPYRSSAEYGGQIKTAWRTATRRAELEGFTPHDLRHTWATWHYSLYKDLLRLKAEGGWSSVTLVERYAHLMPVGHEAGIRSVWGLWPGGEEERKQA